jgi:hypothetical protein
MDRDDTEVFARGIVAHDQLLVTQLMDVAKDVHRHAAPRE